MIAHHDSSPWLSSLRLAAVLMLAAGCGKSAHLATTHLDTSGGTVHSSDGALTLSFPAGALSAATDITVQVVDQGVPYDAVTPIYAIGPEGLTLKQPVAITLVSSIAVLANRRGALLNVDDHTEVDGSSYDAASRTFSGSLHHFSRYAGYGLYQPCAGKQCGDRCSACDPLDRSCVETAVVKTCHADDTCSATASSCSTLQWYQTCGDPLCGAFKAPAGMRKCTSESAGAACSTANDICYLDGNACNIDLLCTSQDPTLPGCPISRRAHKTDIDYVSAKGLAQIGNQLLHMRLARYRYKNEPPTDRLHLGFIIDDAPNSPAVLPNGQHVDLYGFTSMAVAALQVQAKQIATLQAQVKALQHACVAADTVPMKHR